VITGGQHNKKEHTGNAISEQTRAEKLVPFRRMPVRTGTFRFRIEQVVECIYYAFILLQAFPVTYLSVAERSKPNVRQVFQMGRVNYFWREVIGFSQVVLMNIQVFSDVTPCRLAKKSDISGKCLILKRKVLRFSETSVNIYQSTCNITKGPEYSSFYIM